MASPTTAPVIEQQPITHRPARRIPQVSLYTRHAVDCRYKGRETANTCACPKWLRWIEDGKLRRVSARTNDPRVAEKAKADKQAAFEARADGKVAARAQQEVPFLVDAIAHFAQTKSKRGTITAKYVARIESELGTFEKWCAQRNVTMLGDVSPAHVQDYRNSLPGSQTTRRKKVFRIKGFFRYCVEMGWLAKSPAVSRELSVEASKHQTPRALADAEYETLLAAVSSLDGKQQTTDRRRKLRGVVLLMNATGLAIRDAISIERSRFTLNGHGFYKLFLRREKTGHPAECVIAPQVVEEILSLGNPAPAKYLFVDAWPDKEQDAQYKPEQRAQREIQRDNLTNQWGQLMKRLGVLAKLQGFGSHWLRHTFVGRMLRAGLPTEDVAVLIGDTPLMVQQHYSDWIEERNSTLAARMIRILTPLPPE
jgi:integrase/recombinase XerD